MVFLLKYVVKTFVELDFVLFAPDEFESEEFSLRLQASKSKGIAGKVWQAFKDRWQIGSHYIDYLPPTKGPTAYRTPSPGSAPNVLMPHLHAPKELEYNTTYFKRRDIQFKQAPGFPPGYGADGSLPPGVEVPPHTPIPRWMRTPKDVEYIKKFKEQTGLTLLGRNPMPSANARAVYVAPLAPPQYKYNIPYDWRDDTRDYLKETVYRHGEKNSPFTEPPKPEASS